MGAKDLYRVTDSGQPHRKPLPTSPHTPCCRKPTRFSTPCGKDCGLFPVFSQPVENRVENPGIQPRMHFPTGTDCPCVQQFPPNVVLSCGLWICIKTGQGIPRGIPHVPPGHSTYRSGETPGFPTEKQKNPSTTTGLSHRKRRFFPRIPPKKHRSERISTIRRDRIRRFITETGRKRIRKIPVVPVSSGFPQFPALYCSCCWIEGIKRQTDGLIARARAEKPTGKEGRHSQTRRATRRTEERRRKNAAVPESPARTHIY